MHRGGLASPSNLGVAALSKRLSDVSWPQTRLTRVLRSSCAAMASVELDGDRARDERGCEVDAIQWDGQELPGEGSGFAVHSSVLDRQHATVIDRPVPSLPRVQRHGGDDEFRGSAPNVEHDAVSDMDGHAFGFGPHERGGLALRPGVGGERPESSAVRVIQVATDGDRAIRARR